MVRDPIRALVVGIDDELLRELTNEEGFTVDRVERLDGSATPDVNAVILSLSGEPLEALATVRAQAPTAAVVVITDPANAADGTVAMHAGADDHLVRGSIPPGMLPRAVRYAVTVRRLRRELTTQDDETGLPNLRGFAPIAEHHLRMADRAHTPAVFLFVRLEGLRDAANAGGGGRPRARGGSPRARGRPRLGRPRPDQPRHVLRPPDGRGARGRGARALPSRGDDRRERRPPGPAAAPLPSRSGRPSTTRISRAPSSRSSRPPIAGWPRRPLPDDPRAHELRIRLETRPATRPHHEESQRTR